VIGGPSTSFSRPLDVRAGFSLMLNHWALYLREIRFVIFKTSHRVPLHGSDIIPRFCVIELHADSEQTPTHVDFSSEVVDN
jgi:hypothetical protein